MENEDEDIKPRRGPITRFTPEERERLLKMLETHERAIWLWSIVGLWAKWVVSVAAAVVVLQAIWSGFWKGPPLK